MQEDDLRYRVLNGDRPVAAGRRSGGWVSLSGSAGSAVAVVRDLWQEYPKGLAVATGAGDAGIDIGIWPRQHAQPLAFTTPYRVPALRFGGYRQPGDVPRPLRDEAEVARLLAANPTAPLNLKSFNVRSVEDARWVEEVIERLAPDRVRTYNDTGTEDGTGAAKTTEIHLKLGPGVIDDAAAARFAATVNEPLTAMVEPCHLAASGAIGHFHHAGDPRFAAADRDLDEYFPLITSDPVEPSRRYGMMRYGNAVCVHSSAVGWVYLLYRERAPQKALRSVGPYHNEGQRPDHGSVVPRGAHRRPGTPAAGAALLARGGRHRLRARRPAAPATGRADALPQRPRVERRHVALALPGQRPADRLLPDRQPAPAGGGARGRRPHRAHAGAGRHPELPRRRPAPRVRRPAVGAAGAVPGDLGALLRRARRALPCLAAAPRSRCRAGSPTPWRPAASRATRRWCARRACRRWRGATSTTCSSRRCGCSRRRRCENSCWPRRTTGCGGVRATCSNYACSTVCFAYDLTGREEYAAYARNLIDTLFHEFIESMRAGEQMDFAAMRFSGYVPRLIRIVASAMERDREQHSVYPLGGGFRGAQSRRRKSRLSG